MYSGPDTSCKVAPLVPGTRYSFCVKAVSLHGHSAYSACSAFTTLASVPAQPEPPKQVGADKPYPYSLTKRHISGAMAWSCSLVRCWPNYTVCRERPNARLHD